jgi:eukaryotic-like serine/threonine-protein kinase
VTRYPTDTHSGRLYIESIFGRELLTSSLRTGCMDEEGSEYPLGTVFGDIFSLDAALGKGGMGVVYSATELQTKRRVALKILPPTKIDSEEAKNAANRFTREAEMLRSMQHPGVVEYVSTGTTREGARYLAMEQLDGDTLLNRARREPLQTAEALEVGEQACEALSYTHQKSIIHRDLKPANIFLCAGDKIRVKLIDFGIARFMEDRRRLTRVGGFIGTPAYMAPEQLRGDPQIDGRLDLYSLAVTLYEAMSRQLPIDAPDTISLLLKVLHEKPRPIREVCQQVPPALERILTRAFAKYPKDRFSSADEMAEAFRLAKQNPNAPAEQNTRVTRPVRFGNPTLQSDLKQASNEPPEEKKVKQSQSGQDRSPLQPKRDSREQVTAPKPSMLPTPAVGSPSLAALRKAEEDLKKSLPASQAGLSTNHALPATKRSSVEELRRAAKNPLLTPVAGSPALIKPSLMTIPSTSYSTEPDSHKLSDEELSDATIRMEVSLDPMLLTNELQEDLKSTQRNSPIETEHDELLLTEVEGTDATSTFRTLTNSLQGVVPDSQDDLYETSILGRDEGKTLFMVNEAEFFEDEPTQARAQAIYEVRRVMVVLAEGPEGAALPKEALSRCATLLTEAGGKVERFSDGRVVGLFGASHSYGDEARRAVSGALQSKSPELRIGVGSGRFLSNEEAKGAVPQAAEVVAKARPGEILLSEEAFRRVRGLFDVERLEVGLRVFAERPDGVLIGTRTLLGVETQTVGREQEISFIRDQLSKTKQTGQSHGVLVLGEPGLGKSRLKFELRLALEELRVEAFYIEGFGDPIRAKAPYGHFSSALKMLGNIKAGDSPEARRKKLTSITTTLLGEEVRAQNLQEIVTSISAAIGLESSKHASPVGAKSRAEDAFVALFSAAARQHTVVFAFEDLQWADEGTLRLIELLLQRVPGPLFFFGTARPSLPIERPNFFTQKNCSRLTLGPISKEAIETFLAALFREKAPEKLLSLLQDATGGNPFLLEEVLAALRDEGVLASDESGLWVVTRDTAQVPLPAGAEALLQERLDRLSPEEKDLLKKASIFGRVFWVEGLASLFVENAFAILEQLRAKEYVSSRPESRIANTHEYVFRHALVCDVAYELLPEVDRQELHAKAAPWLEKAGEEDHFILARHYELALEGDLAAQHYLHAASRYAQEYSSSAAMDAIYHAKRFAHEPALRFELFLLEEDLLFWAGNRDQERHTLQDLKQLSSSGEPWWQIRIDHREARYANQVGQYVYAQEVARRAVKLAGELNDTEGGLLAQGQLIWAIVNVGRYEEGLALARQAIPIARQLRRDDQRALLLLLMGFAYGRCGELGLSARYTQESLQSARQSGEPHLEAMALSNLASVLVVIGCYTEAEQYTRETITLAGRAADQVSLAFAWMNLGNALALQGRFEEAEAALAEAFTLAQRAEHPEIPDVVRCYLAHLYLMRNHAGDPQAAQALAEQVLNSPHAGNLQLNAYAYLWRSRAQLVFGDISRALASVEAGLQLREDLGSLKEEEEELLFSHYLILTALRRNGEAWSALVQANSFVDNRAQKLADGGYREAYLNKSIAAVAIKRAWQERSISNR